MIGENNYWLLNNTTSFFRCGVILLVSNTFLTTMKHNPYKPDYECPSDIVEKAIKLASTESASNLSAKSKERYDAYDLAAELHDLHDMIYAQTGERNAGLKVLEQIADNVLRCNAESSRSDVEITINIGCNNTGYDEEFEWDATHEQTISLKHETQALSFTLCSIGYVYLFSPETPYKDASEINLHECLASLQPLTEKPKFSDDVKAIVNHREAIIPADMLNQNTFWYSFLQYKGINEHLNNFKLEDIPQDKVFDDFNFAAASYEEEIGFVQQANYSMNTP